MISIMIRYIAVVAEEGGTARVAFPREAHDLHVYLNGRDEGSAPEIALRVLNKDGSGAAVERVRGLPMGEPVLSIRRLSAGGPYHLKSTQELLDSDLAQTVLTIPTGKFRAKLPHTKSAYATSRWDIGGGVRQELTDQCICRIEFDAALDYRLEIGRKTVTLNDEDDIVFSNDDTQPGRFKDNGHGRVEIKDVARLYELVEPPPNHRPAPSAPFIPGADRRPGETSITGGGDLPLCPVGEP